MQELTELIQKPQKLNRETLEQLRTLVINYPYFQAARQLFLYNLYLLHDPSFGEELRTSALFLPDRRALFNLIEGSHYRIHPPSIDPKEKKLAPEGSKDRTISLLDNFLSSLHEEHPQKPAYSCADIATDYSAFLLQMDDLDQEEEHPAQTNTSLSLLEEKDVFPSPPVFSLNLSPLSQEDTMTSETLETPEEDTEEEETAGSYFTETLAKIYIKQGKYDRAIEIIKGLHLNNPKKNLYFADQIRFLQKLNINSNSKKGHV